MFQSPHISFRISRIEIKNFYSTDLPNCKQGRIRKFINAYWAVEAEYGYASYSIMLYILIVILVYIPTGAILWGYVFEDIASNMESTVPFWKIVTLTTFIPMTYLLLSWLYYWVS